MTTEKIIKISIFCGGSGSESIIKYFSTKENVKLTLLVNAYDDGKSTGKLRKLIPGFLGPSDFRKNFSYLINTTSESQLVLKDILDLRLSRQITLLKFRKFVNDFCARRTVYFSRKKINIYHLENKKKIIIINSLKKIYDYIYLNNKKFDFNDCSLANLIFGGLYLLYNNNFNKALNIYGEIIDSSSKIFNVSSGEEKKLIAINTKKKIIPNEATIVGFRHKNRLKKIYLISNDDYLNYIKNRKIFKKKNIEAFLNKISSIPQISNEAKNSILESDIIIYGPGTQHSSLFPSYITCSEVIKKSKANKIFIMNLDYDKDIYGLRTKEIVNLALKYLNDKSNKRKVINKVLIDKYCKFNNLNNRYKKILISNKNLRNNLLFKYHSGKKLYDEIVNFKNSKKPSLNIFIDLKNLNAFKQSFFDEFFEIQWQDYFKKINVTFNSRNNKIYNKKIKGLEFKLENKDSLYPEVDTFKKCLKSKKYEYLITLSGDGFFKWEDILKNFFIIKDSNFAVLLGSRNQNRHQHQESINQLYSNNKIIYFISKISELLLSIIFFLKLKKLINDPVTGMRIYNFLNLKNLNIENFKNIKTPSGIIKIFSKNKFEISESPVSFFTKKGFTYYLDRYYKNLYNIYELLL